MHALPRALIVGVGLVLGWSTAQAAPGHGATRHKKAKRPVPVAPAEPAEDTAREDTGEAHRPDRAADRAAPPPTDAKQVALGTRDADDAFEDRDARSDAARVVTPAKPSDPGWQVAIGPYVWASSVEADVSFGNSVSTGVDIGFIPLARHARYGAELLAEVRHGRFAISGDLMYGVAAVTGSTSVASVMVSLTGNASSLLVDAAASYDVIGDPDAVFSLEARAGIRYQRTEVNGELSIADFTLQTPDSVDDGSDAVVGARGVLRPARWFSVSAVYDHGVVGVSSSTWSASADANLRVSSHFLISAGWRTLTLDRTLVSLTLQGPRAAVQLVF